MKYYHMIIQRPGPARWGETDGRREYISTKQGSAPAGWVCIAVCGYHEEKRGEKENGKNA
jgi:hypothetical protein